MEIKTDDPKKNITTDQKTTYIKTDDTKKNINTDQKENFYKLWPEFKIAYNL